jgi:hypothetical protein
MKTTIFPFRRAALALSDTPEGPYAYVGSYRINKGLWPVNVTETDKTPKTPEPHAGRLANAVLGQYLRRDYELGQMSRDMTLFVDDDQTGYLITSAEENATLHIHQLTDDYLGFSGKWARALVGDSNEAPAVFKHGGKYYMISSGTTGWRPSDAIDGRYVWLPIEWEDGKPILRWRDSWKLSDLNK